MKRLLSVFFALFYVCTASGVSITAHYCGKSVSSISLFEDAASCSCPAKMKKKGCCSKDSRFIKLKEAHKASSSKNIQPIFKTSDRNCYFQFFVFCPQTDESKVIRSKAPPDDIQLLNRVFRT